MKNLIEDSGVITKNLFWTVLVDRLMTTGIHTSIGNCYTSSYFHTSRKVLKKHEKLVRRHLVARRMTELPVFVSLCYHSNSLRTKGTYITQTSQKVKTNVINRHCRV